MQFETSTQLNRHVAKISDGQALLAFSTGKDSVVAWLQMRRHFKKITPVYMYLIPDLEFVEMGLRYYEKFFKTKILRMPHPSLYRQLNNLTFQAPENCAVIENAMLPNFEYEDIFAVVRQELGLPENTYAGTGVRARDSIARWVSIKTHGPLNESKKSFFPVFDYTKAMMVQELRAAKVRLPVDYRMFGRSFDGVDYRFLKPLKEKFPADYKKILEFFPLAELELKRIEYRERYYQEQNHG
jgi:hypothetical protein